LIIRAFIYRLIARIAHTIANYFVYQWKIINMKKYEEIANNIFFENTGLNSSVAEDILNETLKGADDGELFLEYCQSEFLAWDDGRLKNSSYDTDMGFGMRSVVGDLFGYSYSSEISKDALLRAGATVKSVINGYSGVMGDNSSKINKPLYINDNPIDEISFNDKLKLLQDIDSYARSKDTRITQVSVTMSASWQALQILRYGGHKASDIRPLVRLNVSIYMKSADGRMEDSFQGIGGRYAYKSLFEEKTWKTLVDEAFREAEVKLRSIPAPAGEMDVVLASGWPGVLLHEAVGHGLEGDANRKGTSVFTDMIGQRVASKGVTVVDDGTIENRRGSITIDDEGTPSARNVLIEDGILKAYMQDRMNARLMGTSSTGNGRRESYEDYPIPRMTNTFMLNGNCEREEIISSVKKGIYAVNFDGGQVDTTSGKFVFEASEAYLIEDGKVTTPIKGATLIGSASDIMQKISMIGNDLALDNGVGVCGKDGQSVPVGVGQPSLKIEGITVGGTGE